MRTPNPDIPNIPNTPDVAMPLSSGPARPLVLFPVRLETRFFPLADGSTELRVRVYPDKVHIDSHEPELTADELTWGQHFWEETWRAGNDVERSKAAWQQLADRFDPPRAAWVARALKPLNPADRPASSRRQQPLPIRRAFHRPRRSPSRGRGRRGRACCRTTGSCSGIRTGGWSSTSRAVRFRTYCRPARTRLWPVRTPPPHCRSTRDRRRHEVDRGFRLGGKSRDGHSRPTDERRRCRRPGFSAGDGHQGFADRTTDWTPRLAGLFDAHHYTDGLSFVPRARLRITRPMRRPALARMIPATKRAISPNAPHRPSAWRRVECRCAHGRVGTGQGRSGLRQPPQCHGDRAARRAAHEHRVVAGDVGLLPAADARRRRHQRKPADRRRHRLGEASFHRLRARERAAAGRAHRQGALRLSARDLAECLEATGG